VEIHHDGDLPARSGMGSSSSFTVGLLHALHALSGRMVSKQQLASEGMHVEQELLQETVGSQDQVLTAYGGLNHVRFPPSGEISVRPVIMPAERMTLLNNHVMLIYTGIKRTASLIADTFVPELNQRRRELRIMQELVEEGLAVLASDCDLTRFGALLHDGWQVKQSLSPSVSNQSVDDIYQAARKAGALGGKLLGAGGGGFLMLFTPPDRQDAVRNCLPGLIHVPCNFEFAGSQIIFYDRETDYSVQERARLDGQIRPFQELTEIPK
jgi:D-glycero-alpha-D-manno-heptose-7-phosphate kinase